MDERQHARKDDGRDDGRNRLLLGLGAGLAVLAAIAAVVMLRDDDPVATTGTSLTTTTTDATTTSTEATTTSTSEAAPPAVDPAQAVFPDPTSARRFDDPVAVATAFATDLVGFSAPVVGAFQQGDSRSGEVEVRAVADGAVTVVLVRQLDDDTWFVIGATTDSIRLTTPAQGAAITSPQPLAGMAYAFEGTVDVRLYADGTEEPIATTFVTGRGDGVLGDFTGELAFTDDTGAAYGVLVLSSEAGPDNAPGAATAIRVAL